LTNKISDIIDPHPHRGDVENCGGKFRVCYLEIETNKGLEKLQHSSKHAIFTFRSYKMTCRVFIT
jgi:hypothetical protein